MTIANVAGATGESSSEDNPEGQLRVSVTPKVAKRDRLLEQITDNFEGILKRIRVGLDLDKETNLVRNLVLKAPERALRDQEFWATLKEIFVKNRENSLGLTSEEMRHMLGGYLKRDFFPSNMEEEVMLSFLKIIHHHHRNGTLFEYRNMLKQLAKRDANGSEEKKEGRINGHRVA
ncbi:MAG: hypothetical protein OXU73_00255 [Candidatus Campbellbacteria bacterium]|nr:hypothetical protein [Candidatus Campbellbacteria bacterium]